LKNLKLVLIMVLIIALLLLATACIGSESELKPSLEPGTPAPEFSLSTLAGDEYTVPKDFEGQAVVMMFFSLG
jgi:hypothetical protein